MSPINAKGSCLCGKVKYQITGHMGIFQYCHCSRCRKFTGSAHAANLFVSPQNFSWIAGEDQVGRFEPEGTKHFATCFCRNCGSSLPWLAKSGRTVIIPAGTLDTRIDLKPFQNVFWDSRATWYEEVCELPKYAELP
ncbi:MAG: GFA family protein [Gammaproteobacteria bacterium]|nr:GFA family protein [Gammaproteobacteria bacterium]